MSEEQTLKEQNRSFFNFHVNKISNSVELTINSSNENVNKGVSRFHRFSGLGRLSMVFERVALVCCISRNLMKSLVRIIYSKKLP